MKRSKNNAAMLGFAGLIGVPMLAIFISSLRGGGSSFWGKFKEEGMDSFKETYKVNGVETAANPFAPSGSRASSYVYKHKEFSHLQDKPWMK